MPQPERPRPLAVLLGVVVHDPRLLPARLGHRLGHAVEGDRGVGGEVVGVAEGLGVPGGCRHEVAAVLVVAEAHQLHARVGDQDGAPAEHAVDEVMLAVLHGVLPVRVQRPEDGVGEVLLLEVLLHEEVPLLLALAVLEHHGLHRVVLAHARGADEAVLLARGAVAVDQRLAALQGLAVVVVDNVEALRRERGGVSGVTPHDVAAPQAGVLGKRSLRGELSLVAIVQDGHGVAL
mmetsp:Transcript_16003/g.34761  ORF Transcript_16003/g.34761 Transcript_16003/m.34761 type:complete len:234 (+) Transcript_16003:542-1243(+)